jgi:peptidyl-dipeptidase Dcp
MKRIIIWINLFLIGLSFSCNNENTKTTDSMKNENPLLSEWIGENGGFPPFDIIKVEYFKPAIELGMQQQMEDIENIINNPEQPTFENTIVKLEKSGDLLTNILPIYWVWSLNMSDSTFQQLEQEMNPLLTQMRDKIMQNRILFDRVESVKKSDSFQELNSEQQRLVNLMYADFVKLGVKLDSVSKARVTEINQELSVLFSKFNQNLLGDETSQYIVLENESQIKGLPDAFTTSLEKVAKEKNEGKWIVSNTRSFVDPYLTYAQCRETRQKVWKAFVKRGDNENSNNNNSIVKQIVALRHERAKLLGYETHAHLQLDNKMAGDPYTAMKLMTDVWQFANKRVAEEVADMQNVVNKEGGDFKIAPWDYHFYSEKVRKEKYDIDQNEVKEYLQLEKLKEAMFWVSGRLFDISFERKNHIPVFHQDVEVWEVINSKTNKHIGYWYFDPYARNGKRSGAWMMSYRDQSRIDRDVYSMVSNNSNFVKPNDGEPVLLSWDDAVTLFHEFGHALHGLCSDVTYPYLSGTSVVRDYVEFPSQVFERWLAVPEVLSKFALHHKTCEPMPLELIEKIKSASTFKQGFKTAEYLASGIVDMKLHLEYKPDFSPAEFEKRILSEINMPNQLVMRHRLPQFSHLFSSDSYSAGYYSYLWSDVIATDAFAAFEEENNYFHKPTANKLMKYVFSAGNKRDPAEAYIQFRGRTPDAKALMINRGFVE